MNPPGIPGDRHHVAGRTKGSGMALVICLLLLLVLSVLAISGATTAVTEQRLAGNELHTAQAFEAAESGLIQAMADTTLSADPAATVGEFDGASGPEPVPRRGHGAQIDGCANADATPGGRCEYFVRFDSAGGITPVPKEVADPDRRACHFAVESFGVAGRGGRCELTAGFYLLGPADCSGPLTGPAVRTYWRQRGVD